ncbi:MAG: hypothetical protein WC829_22880, partial [Hyphomicrobium sp.]|jgi:hypothetical protein
LRFVVDWLSGANFLPTIDVEPPVARDASAILRFLKSQQAIADAPTPRDRGIRFHRDEFSRLFEAVDGWPTVEFITSHGLPVDSVDDLPRGADGGIDVVVRIITPTERGARIVAGRIRNMIVNQTYE